jgi:hypothetical protein
MLSNAEFTVAIMRTDNADDPDIYDAHLFTKIEVTSSMVYALNPKAWLTSCF